MLRLLLVAGLAVAVLISCGGGEDEPEQPGVLVSIGDSLAAGSGASDPSQTSYAALLAQERGLELVNLGTANASTGEVLEHQVLRLAEEVGERDVEVVVISAGGNDLAELIPNASCQEQPTPDTCPLDQPMLRIAQGMRFILGRVEPAYPEAEIVFLAPPNFFSGTGHAFEPPAEAVLGRLRGLMEAVVNAEAGHVVVAAPSFEGQGGELTHLLDEPSDPHPNDAGYRVIADAITEALNAEP